MGKVGGAAVDRGRRRIAALDQGRGRTPCSGRSAVTDEQHDVVVVGGGPAGVSCALECFDIKLDVLLLEGGDALGGQLPEIPHAVRNVAVGRFASGPAVQGAMEDAATILGDRARLGHAVSAVDVTAPAVEAAGTRFPARALVIATGAARRELPAAPDGAFGGDVSYLIESRPGWFAGRDVVVVGG
ncbi:MAG: FAD-binding protein, partial [Actinobacteria bacterium]